jgi:CRISPR-associated protein Cmr1
MTKMKQEEDEIWGAAAKNQKEADSKRKDSPPKKTVQISVEQLSDGAKKTPFGQDSNRISVPPYAGFSLRPNAREGISAKSVRENISFKLTISFLADQLADVEAALWAWETFGGIGARTRRGFGAKSWMEEKLKTFVADGKCPEGVPHLSHTMQFQIMPPSRRPSDTWKLLISKLSEFRQAPYGRSGRSNWPEPEAIREITKSRYKRYSRLSHPHKFPRAAFGLPIVFHFKDVDKGDPNDTTLQGKEEGKVRFASPLILRPLVCRDGRAIGLAVLLEGSRVYAEGLELVENDSGNKYPADATLTHNEANVILTLKGETDPLKAFMNYLGGNTR